MYLHEKTKKKNFVDKKSPLSMENILCLLNVLSMKCPIYGMSYIYNVLYMECPIYGMSYILNVLSMECLIYEMSYIWNVLYMECPIYEMSVYEMYFYAMSYL